MKVRTRFAPSPTGYLHVGGIRTALFAWLLARQNGGQFVLRLEDTDKKREVKGADKHIEDSLKALGLDYDEGPDIGGPYAPYRQSQRLDSYKKWAQKLIKSGRAYWDVSSPEDLDKLRKTAEGVHRPFLFRNHRPSETPEGDFFGKYPLRFKSEPKAYSWHDEVMGESMNHADAIDDFILIKSDGYPTYNFAHIIDDMEMEITHVIRGQEFLASVPNYLNLYEALGFERPVLATMPHILGPDGNKKLSKRDGAKDVLDYINQGFLPEALISFIATLGWNDGSEQEIYSRQELTDKFSLDRVQRSGARFDEHRLEWTNGHFIRQTPLEELYKLSEPFWPDSAKEADQAYRQSVLALVQERLKYLAELPQLTDFFFADLPVKQELINDNKQLQKFSPQQMREMLVKSREAMAESDFSQSDLADRLNKLLQETGQKPGVLFSLIRITTTWVPASPGLAETLSLLGKDKTLDRLDMAISLMDKT